MGKKIKFRDIKTGKISFYDEENVGIHTVKEALELGLLNGMSREKKWNIKNDKNNK